MNNKILIILLILSLFLVNSCIPQKPVAIGTGNCNLKSDVVQKEVNKCKVERNNCKLACEDNLQVNLRMCNEACNENYDSCYKLVGQKLAELCSGRS